MKKWIFIIIGIALIIFAIHKVYHFVVVDKLYAEIEEFSKQENRYCLVEEVENGKQICKQEIFIKNKIIKYVSFKNNENFYYEWKNISTNEQYLVNPENKMFSKNGLFISDEEIMPTLPDIVSFGKLDENKNIRKIFDIYYIIPIQYNDKSCYKIVTNSETVVIDKETYLPVYSSVRIINSENNEKYERENFYKFTVGEVKDEDVMLPDLTEYTSVDKIE